MERLQKILAQAQVGSRRYCESLIAAGRVQVNGRIARLGDKADRQQDQILLDGKPIQRTEKYLYIALHKPRGVISSLTDELNQGRTTIRDLISLPGHLYPVGRLDKQSTGLILMTNDGQLAHQLTHPRYGHEKQYQVVVAGNLSPRTIKCWQQGVMLDNKMTAPTTITDVVRTSTKSSFRIIMREGRKRQIRRIAALLGHPVQRLVRVQIGPIQLGELQPGKWRYLQKAEVRALQGALRRQSPKRQHHRSAAHRPSKRNLY